MSTVEVSREALATLVDEARSQQLYVDGEYAIELQNAVDTASDALDDGK